MTTARKPKIEQFNLTGFELCIKMALFYYYKETYSKSGGLEIISVDV